jgi:hypothetical protein
MSCHYHIGYKITEKLVYIGADTGDTNPSTCTQLEIFRYPSIEADPSGCIIRILQLTGITDAIETFLIECFSRFFRVIRNYSVGLI